MISSRRHTETDPKTGKNLYIVECYLRDPETQKISDVPNKEFEGERYKLHFTRGVARTTSKNKAQWLSEQFDLVVTLHKDDEPWAEVGENQREIVSVEEEDSSYTIDNEED